MMPPELPLAQIPSCNTYPYHKSLLLDVFYRDLLLAAVSEHGQVQC